MHLRIRVSQSESQILFVNLETRNPRLPVYPIFQDTLFILQPALNQLVS